MKRIICAIVAVLLVIGSLAGCSKSANTGETDNKISVMGIPSVAADKNSETEQWLENKYGFDIEIYSVTSNYFEKLSTMLASGEVPDVMYIDEPQNWQALVDQGFLAEVPLELIEKYAPKHFAAINSVDNRIWAISSYKDANWAIPKYSQNEYSTSMIWRKDWLEKLGIEKVPETLDEMEQAFIKVRDGDPDGNGKKDTYGMTGSGGANQRQFDAIFGAFGIMPGQWIVENGKVTNSTISPKAKEALTLLNKWYSMGLIDPEMITDSQEDHLRKFQGDRVACFNTSVNNMSAKTLSGIRNKENFEAAHPGAKFEDAVAFGQLPLGKNGDRGDWLWGPRTNFVVFGSHLEDDEEKLGRILSMLDDINYDEETALRVQFGEKGVTYDYNDSKIGPASGLKFLPPYDSDSAARASKGIGGFFNMFVCGGSWCGEDIAAKYSDPELMKIQEEYSAEGRYQDALMRPYLESATRFQGELDKLKTTAYSEFITGVRSLDNWDDFVNEYLQSGGEQLQKEAQEFYKTNFNN